MVSLFGYIGYGYNVGTFEYIVTTIIRVEARPSLRNS